MNEIGDIRQMIGALQSSVEGLGHEVHDMRAEQHNFAREMRAEQHEMMREHAVTREMVREHRAGSRVLAWIGATAIAVAGAMKGVDLLGR